jgi:predicted PurR-regulated permease PerM
MTSDTRTEAVDGPAAVEGGSPVRRKPDSTPRYSWLWVVTAGGGALALGIGLLAALWFLQRPLAILFISLTIAAALAPAVEWIERWLPRTLAVVVAYLIVALFLSLLGLIVIPPLVDQAGVMTQRIPELAGQAEQWLQQRFKSLQLSGLDQLLSPLAGVGSRLLSLPLQISSSILDVLLVVFASLYALIAAPHTHKLVLSLVPQGQEERVEGILGRVVHNIGGYVRGATMTGAIIGSLGYVGLLVIGVDFPLVLAIMAGLLEFIPFIGPLIAGTVVVTVALLQSPTKALITFAFALALQQLEGSLIHPNIMGSQTRISPLTTLFAIFTGFEVGGVLGALVSVPIAAGLRVLVLELLVPAVRQRTGAEERGEGSVRQDRGEGGEDEGGL